MLLIDIGNSRIKWALEEGGEWLPGEAEPHDHKALPEALLERWRRIAPPGQVVAASVAGAPLREALAHFCRICWKIEPEWIEGAREGFGLTSRYDLRRLGVDRWLALVAARHLAPVWVIDCGTAVTIDRIDAEGCHRGGVILPGLGLMRGALGRATAALPSLPAVTRRHQTGLGLATEEAIELGTLAAVTGAIGQLVERHLDHARTLTGGDAEVILPHLKQEYDRDPLLVLRGLRIVATTTR